jgi:hypothetical protein
LHFWSENRDLRKPAAPLIYINVPIIGLCANAQKLRWPHDYDCSVFPCRTDPTGRHADPSQWRRVLRLRFDATPGGDTKPDVAAHAGP